MRLVGRDSECATLDALLAQARSGHSAALVLRGEAGVGKTALLRHAERSAAAAHTISGVESEADFPYAALHRLLLPLLPQRDRLPDSQRAAIEVACGLADGPPADLFLVSLAALTLLARTPRLFVVDDAQWLDRESLRALAFVGRRLHAEGVVLLFGVRPEAGDADLLAGLPVLEIGGLPPDEATRLLAEVVGAPVDPDLARRIADATGGNPLALTDLARELTTAQLRGSAPLPDPAPIGSRLEAHYSAQVWGYPAETRTWLLLVAANAGRSTSTLAAADRLGIDASAAGPAEADRLVTGSPPVEFRHPLVRSAVYGSAAPAQRRAVHAALAAVTDPGTDADRRAWHLAAASTGPDEAVAAELERGADRAGARGGHTARAAFLTKAAELTVDPERRAVRLVRAAEAAHKAGAATRALHLLKEGARAVEPERGTALLIQANASVTAGVPQANRRASAICLAAAEAFGATRPEQARAAVLHAVEHAITVEHLIEDTTEADLAAAARRLAGDRPTGTAALLLAGYAALIEDGIGPGAQALRRAVAAVNDPRLPAAELLPHLVVAVHLCTVLWDDRARQSILDRGEAASRRTGALQALGVIHFMATMSDTALGRLTEADRHDMAGIRLRRAIGITAERELVWRHPELVAWRLGRAERDTLRPALDLFHQVGLGSMVTLTQHSLAISDLGHGDYASARDRLRPLVEPGRPGRYARVLPDLVEAALRAGDRRTAESACADLAEAARRAGTPWARGLLHRSRALLAGADQAEEHYRQATETLTGTLAHGDLARAHLVHGEWLRRRRRRRDARQQLTTALEMFEGVRATAFVDRARRELAALGHTLDRPAPMDDQTALTPQEAAVARLARAGGTNAEIAAHLFLSANTVDYHLRKVYRKLGVASRRELRDVLHD
ncbi:AAA family ATPase [Asanoa sp. WMMD1127]|uniref:helix-turn-helix transcriptional regulator n=1 Tax=Asanoa sp. WMMD1127 TaxID=3016107 RepID=UPI0024168238|nr:AAA family ATPase [Asanoa sp. WMMD1127]MDG4825694.1 AAA family ATPase [Asanoa sp. WMMD1127]